MSSAAIIEEIKHLPPAEQAEVIRFAVQLAQTRPLAPDELTRLADRLAQTTNPAEAERLKSAIAPTVAGRNPPRNLAAELHDLPPNPDWPSDGAAQHDHYLYGTPKRP